jgi:hypothetical protein
MCMEESMTLQEEKVDRIRQCLAQDSVDLWRLRELALTRGGLVNGRFPYSNVGYVARESLMLLFVCVYVCVLHYTYSRNEKSRLASACRT